MKLNFLSKKQAKDLFKEADSYARGLPLSNLKMINPVDPTLAGYQKIFLDSFTNFTKGEISEILEMAEAHLSMLALEINLVKTKKTHALDITQTRNNSILIARGGIDSSTFVHEVYHILSRHNPELTPKLAGLLGFKVVSPQVIKYPSFILNPDAELCNYSKEVEVRDGQKIIVVPFMKIWGQVGLKLLNEEIYYDEYDTNYRKLIPNTSYIAHPEEICAEHFALTITKKCIFQSERLDMNVLDTFKKVLNEEMVTIGLKLFL